MDGKGLSGVGYGPDSVTSSDVWLENPVAMAPILPLTWPASSRPANQPKAQAIADKMPASSGAADPLRYGETPATAFESNESAARTDSTQPLRATASGVEPSNGRPTSSDQKNGVEPQSHTSAGPGTWDWDKAFEASKMVMASLPGQRPGRRLQYLPDTADGSFPRSKEAIQSAMRQLTRLCGAAVESLAIMSNAHSIAVLRVGDAAEALGAGSAAMIPSRGAGPLAAAGSRMQQHSGAFAECKMELQELQAFIVRQNEGSSVHEVCAVHRSWQPTVATA